MVFEVKEEFQICARITNKPADFVGTWFSNKYIVSGDFLWLAHKVNLHNTILNL